MPTPFDTRSPKAEEEAAVVGTLELAAPQAEQLVSLALFSRVHTEHDQPPTVATFIGEVYSQAVHLELSRLFSNVHFGHDHKVGGGLFLLLRSTEEEEGRHYLDPADSNLLSRASLTKSLSRLLVEGGRFLFTDIIAAVFC